MRKHGEDAIAELAAYRPRGGACRAPDQTNCELTSTRGEVGSWPQRPPRAPELSDDDDEDERPADGAEEDAGRGVVRVLHCEGERAPAAYPHQIASRMKIQDGSSFVPPVSGIVHLPTGGGKTRVALEVVASVLKDDPHHRFIWATLSKQLIQQTMTRVEEFAPQLPDGFRMAWYGGHPDLLDQDLHLAFFTQHHLREVLAEASDGRRMHPWRTRLESGRALTLIYDESHQLGADQLQRELRKFYERVAAPPGSPARRWRVIGLSATPVPTREDARPLLTKTLFPLRAEARSASSDWGMHVFHRVDNKTLLANGVICPLNMRLDETREFDIPVQMLKGVVDGWGLHAPGPHAAKQVVMKYAEKFNGAVMKHPDVLGFLASKLARNLPVIGKTLVFVPTIDAANQLVAALHEYPECAGKVAGVHSKMDDFRNAVPGQRKQTPEEVLRRFRQRGGEPCILVNVEMLTEGFDDPLVQTVVLAKLTLSTNRFWQMIGRGTRGKAAGGTSECFVIDPIKLVRLYDYFAGYQPAVGSAPGTAIEDEPEARGPGALNPSVPTVSRPPLPSSMPFKITDELRRTHARVAKAIEAFLQGGSLGEEDAIAVGCGSSPAEESTASSLT